MNRRFLSLAVSLSLVLSGCGLLGGAQPAPQATATVALPLELPSPTLPVVPAGGEQPTAMSLPCVTLVMPADGATLSASGQEQFGWTEYAGATGYLLLFTHPDGTQTATVAPLNQYDLALETLPQAGLYQWSVAVLGANSQVVCTSTPFTFQRAESAASAETPAATPSESPVPTAPSTSEAPAPTAPSTSSCMTLLTPPHTAKVHRTGGRAFTWTPVRGATRYIVAITPPSTPTVRFLSTTTALTRYMEGFSEYGVYRWQVTAYEGANVLCTSDTFEFTLGYYPVPPPVPGTCVTLLTPKNQTEFPALAAAEFSWTAYPGASQYRLTIVTPGGALNNLLSPGTSKIHAIEAFPDAGTYQWFVSPMLSDGAVLCTSEIFTFTKPKTKIPTPQP